MRSPKGLLMLATLALFFSASAWGACPDDPDCLWVDLAACGECADDGRNCGQNSDCSIGTCTGTCTIGGAACVGDAECQPNNGLCFGLCNDGVTGCFGNGGCKVCNGETPGTGSQAAPFCMVNSAFQVASPGDTLYVAPGTYGQCVDVSPLGVNSGAVDRPVHLLAQAFAAAQDPGTIADTVIDGTGLCLQGPLEGAGDDVPVVTIEGSASALTGFTITGGGASGVYVSGGSVTVSNNRITGNQSVEGAGIAVRTEACNYGGFAEVIISDNEITNNAASPEPQGFLGESLGHGGGVHVFSLEDFGQGCNSFVTTRIEDNIITGNTIKNTNTTSTGARYVAKGGGIWATTAMEPGGAALIRIIGNEISDNGPTADTPTSAGGGIFATTRADGFGTETIIIEGNTIGPDNRAHEGGGIAAWAISSPTANHHIDISKNEIKDNTGFSTSGAGAGGGVSLRVEAIDMHTGDAISLDFDQNRVTGNLADSTDGGGVRASLLSERSVYEPFSINNSPADRMELNIRDNTIQNNTAAVGGAGALLLILVDADPVFGNTGNCGTAQLPANGRVLFSRNLVTNNRAANVSGFTEVGAGILVIPTTFGEVRGEVIIEDSTIAGNTITEDFGGAGGLETLAFVDPDCNGQIDVEVEVSMDRSIVDSNTGYGLGATLLSNELPTPPPTALATPSSNSYIFDNPAGAFVPGYPTAGENNFLVDPDLTGAYAPNACSPVFDLKVCDGTTTTCVDDLSCPAGPPQVTCVTGVGFHGNPDISPDSIIDGLDILDLAVAFTSTDAPDPRYSAAADLDHNGMVDGEDLSYMGSQFGQVCVP